MCGAIDFQCLLNKQTLFGSENFRGCIWVQGQAWASPEQAPMFMCLGVTISNIHQMVHFLYLHLLVLGWNNTTRESRKIIFAFHSCYSLPSFLSPLHTETREVCGIWTCCYRAGESSNDETKRIECHSTQVAPLSNSILRITHSHTHTHMQMLKLLKPQIVRGRTSQWQTRNQVGWEIDK